MKVYEFHFNPKVQEDLIVESFCYDPANVYERRLGNLYMAGFLTNALPQNSGFLNSLAKAIKEKYYKNSSSKPERALREALRKANEHLEKIAKDGDVTWLGNLNFAVTSFKNFEINFTKVGDLKIYLLRKGQVIDIDQKLKYEEIEPYPLKIFGNVVSGKLAENDMVLVLTKEVAQAFLREKVLGSMAKILIGDQKNQVKKIKEVMGANKEQLMETKGICLLISLTRDDLNKERETISRSQSMGAFSLKEVFKPILKKFKLPKFSAKKSSAKGKKKGLAVPKISLARPEISLPKLKINMPVLDKKTLYIIFLLLILVLGFFLFQGKKSVQVNEYRNRLNLIREKVDQAEGYLVLIGKDPRAELNANKLLTESWEEIAPLVGIISSFPSDLADGVSDLKDKISAGLFQINKVVEVGDPRLVYEFKPKEFIPQKIAFLNNSIYLYSPYGDGVFSISQNNEGKLLPISRKMEMASPLFDSVLFFQSPDQLINLTGEQFRDPETLKSPYKDFSFDDFSSYQSGLYFLDSASGRITKYPYSRDFKLGLPQTWLENQKAKDYKSMAIDGSVWFLSKNNSIDRYYSGELQNSYVLKLFPEPKEFSQIFTSFNFAHLYILEPVQKRIVLIDKSGQVFKQFQSQKFDNLLDFTVSEESGKIWVLNGLKVYEISL